MTATPMAVALALAADGIPSFPCLASKAPACAGGFRAATIDPLEIRRLFAAPDAALVGVPTGAASGIAVVDLDPRHGSDAWPDAKRLPLTRIHETGGGGLHYLFKHSPGLRCSAGKIAPGVDVRAEGGYVVFWPDVLLDEPFAEWPAWLLPTATTAASASAPGARSLDDIAPPSVAAVVALLDALPNPASAGRDVYTETMLAAAGCALATDEPDGPEAIGAAAVRWADRWPGSPGAEAEAAKWESDWLQRTAPLAGWPTLYRHALRSIPGFALEEAIAEFNAAPLPPDGPRARDDGRRAMRDRFVFPADYDASARRGYVIKHLVAPGDVAAIVGPPGCGKSMLAPFLAYAVAQGRPVFGTRTKPGRTLYVAAEDFTGMRQRVQALRLTHGDAPDFALVDCGSLLDRAEADDLCSTVEGYGPALVVIDTVGAAWAGLDENGAGSDGMGAVVALSRRIARTGAAVLLIHHTAKQGDGTPRGHSALNGTLDMALRLEPRDDDGIIRGALGKNRNGTTDRDLAFRFIAVELGTDEDGDPITAPMVVELQSGAVPRVDRLPRAPKAALDILRGMADGGRVAEQDWRAECCDGHRLSTSDDRDARSKAFRRAFAELLDRRLVVSSGGEIWAATGTAPEFSAPGQTGQNPDMSVLSGPTPPGQTGQVPLGLSGVRSARGAPDLSLDSLLESNRSAAGAAIPLNPEVAQ